MKIASTTGDFDRYWTEAFGVKQSLKWMAECGFRHIDMNFYGKLCKEGSPLLGEDWEKWADDLINTADKLGLDFVQAHASDSVYAKGEEREYKTSIIQREMKICQKMGIRGIVLHGLFTPNGSREDFMQTNGEFYGDLLKTSEETGVQMWTENTCTNNLPTYYMLRAEDFHELHAAVNNHPLFGCCWDVGHAHIEGVDQYKEIVGMGDGLRALHIHDNTGIDFHQQPYSGSCSYDPIMMGLLDVGYKGYFTLEANSIPTPADHLGRRGLLKDGVMYDKLRMLPIEFKLRSEKLLYDIAKYMLETYDCFEE